MGRWANTHTTFDGVDEWAVDLVVKEGVRMNLSWDEWTLVAGKLLAKGMGERTIAAWLHISNAEAQTLTHRWHRMKKYWTGDLSVGQGTVNV